MYIAPGQTYTLTDPETGIPIHMTNMDGVNYSISTPRERRMTSDHNIINAIFHGGSLSASGLNFTSLTPEERVELEEIERELNIWKKYQKLLEFQKLPTNIRQDIVNEAYAKTAIDTMSSVDEGNFDNINRLQELRVKDNKISMAGSGMMFNLGGTTWRYEKILNEFTTQELEEAHVSATLEEELSD